MSSQKELPGWPTKALVKRVRSVLWRCVRARPQLTDERWRLTWAWAASEADRSMLFQFGRRARKRWPNENEIASRYLMLCLLEMQSCCALRIGVNAQRDMPAGVARYIDERAQIMRQIGGSVSGPAGLLQLEAEPTGGPA